MSYIKCLNLNDLTTEQLESALTLGEGFTEKVKILDVLNHKELDSISVITEKGVEEFSTLVLYTIVLHDKIENEELERKIYVRVISTGLTANFQQD